jgi:hypothetical protein
MTAEELGLGPLAPLHLTIPELAEITRDVGEKCGRVIRVTFGR